MIKNGILCLSLLASTPCMHALTLESELLHYIDGTIVGWDAVRSMKKYQKKVKHFLNELHPVDGNSQRLFDLAVKEKNGTITDAEKAAFPEFIENFLNFSESFIATLNPVKVGITPLIEESCHKRNRHKSILLAWTKVADGAERELFTSRIHTYKALGELCMDLLNITEDILNSCPKAMHSYHNFLDRVIKIEPLIDALIAADQVQIPYHGVIYYELVRYIAEHYTTNEPVTAEKTAKLYNGYNIKTHIK